MATVGLVSCRDYEREWVSQAVHKAIALLGGIGAFVEKGETVLIKPNLLSAHPPERHITTHPEVVRAVCEMVLEAGGRPFIGDSPALDSFSKVARDTGMLEISKELNVPLMELGEPVLAPDDPRRVFKRIEISKAALKAKKVISIAKLKTHTQMLLTLGVKNNFGTVVKQAKAEWHSTAGMSRDLFASLLLDIYITVNPVLTIIDGIWGMEGRGPTNGTPRHVGILGASRDAIALDTVITKILNIPLRFFPLYRQAKRRGLGTTDLEKIQRLGDVPEDFLIQGFEIPKLDSMSVIPRVMEAFTRKYLVSKPYVYQDRCEGCGKCLHICPQKAIEFKKGAANIDYDKCIRCYCCQEVCDSDAIGFKEGIFLKVTKKVL